MSRIPWNKGKKGVQIAWNRGLTKETDERVAKYAAKLPKSRKGMKLSESHRKNMSIALKGKKPWNKGIPTSEKVKNKLSKLLSGKKNPFYGKKHSKENRKKISISQIGYDITKYKEDIIKMYTKGHSTISIGRKYGIYGSTIRNYLKKWNIPLRKNVYGLKGMFVCKDRHKVRSYPELQIDNFLFTNGIAHEVEKTFDHQNRQFKCDFYIPKLDLYIEYWGIYHNKFYLDRKKIKLKLYKDLKLNLFSIEWNEDPINKLKSLVPLCAKNQTKLF